MINKKKHRWSSFLLLLLVLTVMFCLTGCLENQVALDTRIIMKDGKSGSRVMTLSVEEDNFATILGFSTDSLEQTLKDDCPAFLTWKSRRDEGNYSCSFTLEFSSLKDYKKKVGKITGRAADIKKVAPDHVFTTGIRYEESFTSQELLGWLVKSLKKHGYIESSEEGIFSPGTTSLEYKDQSFTISGDQASFDQLCQRDAQRLDILTTYHKNDLCDRELRIYFDGDTMSEMGQLIKSRMEERCPQKASLDWDSDGEGQYCIFRQENMSSKEVNGFMKSILKGSESLVHGEGARRPSLFRTNTDWNETIDLVNLISNGKRKIPLGYYVAWDKGVKVTVSGHNQKTPFKLRKSDRYQGFKQVWEGNSQGILVTTEFAVSYGINKIQVKDSFRKKKHLDRKISLVLATVPGKEDMDYILTSLQERGNSKAQVALVEDGDGNHQINVSISGTVHQVNEIFSALFQVEAVTSRILSDKLLEFKHTGHLRESLDFTGFVENDPGNTLLEYELTLPGLEKISTDTVISNITVKTGEEKVDGNRYKATVKGPYLEFAMKTSGLNMEGASLGLILLTLFLILILLRLLPNWFGRLFHYMSKGPKNLNKAFEGRDSEDQKLLERRFQEENKRASRDRLLRERLLGENASHEDDSRHSTISPRKPGEEEDWSIEGLVEQVTDTRVNSDEE